jgi:energy-coupling factor transporter ATP-binding protein EcfA2
LLDVSDRRAARFWRCDLQVHSPLEPEFGPGVSATDPNAIADAADQWVAAALKAGLEVVALTDHNAVHFIDAAKKAADGRLTILPGVEISASDGYHVLCIFESSTPTLRLAEFLARIGIGNEEARHPDGKVKLAASEFTFAKILEEVNERGGICIAPHVRRDNGVLKSTMAGDIRVRVWTHPLLLAVEDDRKELRPGSFADDCLANTLDNYKRPRPVARVWGSDAKSYAAIGSSSTMIKMVTPTVEGLRQAFLDPESRIRHPEDYIHFARDRILSVAWDGGFFSGESVELSEQLNCVIGGKGAGKSTLLESVRFVLGLDETSPNGSSYQKLIDSTIPPGTKVTMEIELRDGPRYTISRTPSYEPEVRDADGNLVDVAPAAIFDVDIYSQGQILETARRPMAHLALLDSFVHHELGELKGAEDDLLRRLTDNRRAYVAAVEESERVAENLAEIRRLQEMRKAFEKKGVAARTELRRQLDREERLVAEARSYLGELRATTSSLDKLRQRPALLTEEDLPHAETWAGLRIGWEALATLTDKFISDVDAAIARIETALDHATDPGSEWHKSVREKREDVARVYRELQEEYPDLDLSHFERLDRQLEERLAAGDDQAAASSEVERIRSARADLLSKLRDNRRDQFRARDGLAKRLTRQLGGAIRIDVAFQGQRDALLEKLSGFKTKVRADVLKAIADDPKTTPEALGDALITGSAALAGAFPVSDSQAASLCERISLEEKLALQEFRIPDSVSIEFNLAEEGETPRYRDLGRLSVGQKATSILLILLTQRDKPLVVDQPEDDLDNRFIFKDVVRRLRVAKDTRQLLLATHNANIPVLGDAELIVVLDSEEEAGRPAGRIVDRGSIDSPSIKRCVTQILEGGIEAFRLRQEKYGPPADVEL